MLPKKNPKFDIQKNSSLYFTIGLAFVLFISWQAIEWKTYNKNDYGYQTLDVDEDYNEEIPIIEQIKTPPPPPPPAPEVIEVVEDEEEVEETVIESTETDQDEIVEVDDIEVEDDFEDVDVPFAVIEDAPIYPGCEKVDKSERFQCFQDKIYKHILKTFRYPDIALEMGVQGKVYVYFVIDKDGSITDVKITRGHDMNLENEALRIISKLPKMTPGKQRGRNVRVPYTVPVVFRLN